MVGLDDEEFFDYLTLPQLAGMFLALVGIALGLAGLMERHRQRSYSALGIAFNLGAVWLSGNLWGLALFLME